MECRAHPSENGVSLLNGALFTPDSSTRKISSSKPELLEKKKTSDAAVSESCTAERPIPQKQKAVQLVYSAILDRWGGGGGDFGMCE